MSLRDFLVSQFVDVAHLGRYHLVEDDPSDSGVVKDAVSLAQVCHVLGQTDGYPGMKIHTSLVVGDDDLFRSVEFHAFPFGSGPGFGDVVQTEDHIL